MVASVAMKNMKNFGGPFENFGCGIDMGVGIQVFRYKHCLLRNMNHL